MNEKISRDIVALTDIIGNKYQVETDRPKSDFRNIGKKVNENNLCYKTESNKRIGFDKMY